MSQLNIIQDETKKNRLLSTKVSSSSLRKKRVIEAQAKFDRFWNLYPEQWDPSLYGHERLRIQRTLELIQKHTTLKGRKVVDLGCGVGPLAQVIKRFEALVTVTDISINAIEKMKSKENEDIEYIVCAMPNTLLADYAFDLVIFTDVIADLHPDDYRLAFSEMTRLSKKEGYMVCSTSLDTRTDGALDKFISLAVTELDILDSVISHHKLHLWLLKLLKAPSEYARASSDSNFLYLKLQERKGLRKKLFYWNTRIGLALFWKGLAFILKGPISFLNNSQRWIRAAEKISHAIWYDRSITHVIIIGKRRDPFLKS